MLSPHLQLASQSAGLSPTSIGPETFKRNPLIEAFLGDFDRGTVSRDYPELCGRILRGQSMRDFSTLSPDVHRKIVMLTGGDGLVECIGKSLEQSLAQMGYSPGDIAHHRDKRFQLLVTPADQLLKVATWENLIEITATMYPEVAHLLTRNCEALKTYDLATLQKLAGFSFDEVVRAGVNDERFMTPEAFAQTEGNPWQARLFLYCTVQCRELFAGDGFTRKPDGSCGASEFLAPNIELRLLGKYALIPLEW